MTNPIDQCRSLLAEMVESESWRTTVQTQMLRELDPKRGKDFAILDFSNLSKELGELLYKGFEKRELPIEIPFMGNVVHFGWNPSGYVGRTSYSDYEGLALRRAMLGIVDYFNKIVNDLHWHNGRKHLARTQIRIMHSSSQYYGSGEIDTAHIDGGTYTLLWPIFGPGPFYSENPVHLGSPAKDFGQATDTLRLENGKAIIFRGEQWKKSLHDSLQEGVADGRGLVHSAPDDPMPRILFVIQWL